MSVITVINFLIELLQPTPGKVITNSEYWIAFRHLVNSVERVAPQMPIEGMLTSLCALLLFLAIAWVMDKSTVVQ